MEELLTPKDAAKKLGMRVREVHELARQGRLPHYQVSPRKRRFHPSQVEAFLASCSSEEKKSVDIISLERLVSDRKGGEKTQRRDEPKQGKKSPGSSSLPFRERMKQMRPQKG